MARVLHRASRILVKILVSFLVKILVENSVIFGGFNVFQLYMFEVLV